MKNKICFLFSVAVASFMNAQDVSAIKNVADVYSGDIISGTARYTGMAGSMGALGGDISATADNPAGVAVFVASDINMTLSILSNRNDVSFGKSYEGKDSNTDLGQTGAVFAGNINYGKWKYINFGINYAVRSIDDYVRTPQNHAYAFNYSYGGVVGTELFDGHIYERTGDVMKTAITMGANYDNKIYIGAGVNFYDADIDQRDRYRLSLKNTDEYGDYDKNLTPYTEEGDGLSFSLGIIGRINKFLRLGFALETPIWWDVTKDYAYYGYNNTLVGYGLDYVDQKIETPMKLTFSAAVVNKKNFALNVDYTIGVTEPRYTSRRFNEEYLNDFLKEEYKNLSELKIGGEYRLEDLRFRAGYSYKQNPFEDRALNIFTENSTKEQRSYKDLYLGDRHAWSLGLGYDLNPFYIDVSYQNIQSKYYNPFFSGRYALLYSKDTSLSYYPDGVILDETHSMVSKVKNKKDYFFITLGLKF